MGCTTLAYLKNNLFLCSDTFAIHGTVLGLKWVSEELHQSVKMMIDEHNVFGL